LEHAVAVQAWSRWPEYLGLVLIWSFVAAVLIFVAYFLFRIA
jgi:hypothetical protein